MQKAVLKLDLHDEKDKEKAMKIISGIAGVDSIDMNMEENKLTVTGAVDPVELGSKLKELVSTEIIWVGPAKEAQKDDNRSNKREQLEDSTSDPAEGDSSVGITRLERDNVTPSITFPIPYYYYPPPYYYGTSVKINNPPPLYHYGRYVTGEQDDPNGCVVC